MTAMRETAGAANLGTFEALAAQLDVGVMGAAYRAAVGASVPVLYGMLFGRPAGWAGPLAALLAALVLIRLIPLAGRRILRVSPELRQLWTERRHLAKQYDSYQWRKLLWIGAGMAVSLALSPERPRPFALLCVMCLAAGAAGSWRWHAVRPRP